MSSDTIDLAHGISRLDTHYMKPGIAALYLMREKNRVAIIETGTTHSVPAVIDALRQRGLDVDDVDFVIPTHVHLDHAGGAGELMRVCPRAQLVIHPYGARHMIDPARLVAGTKAVYGEARFERLYGELQPVAAERVLQAPDNFELDFNGRTLRFLDTPGHARHHFCVYDEINGGIFSGDTFGLGYPQLQTDEGRFMFPTTTPVQFDPPALLDSIDRLMALKPQTIYLTHFGPVTPTPYMAEQLKQGVRDFTAIAREERTSGDRRVARIEARLMDYLLGRLDELGCPLPENEIRELLQNDVTLNAQGLDVWLEKATAA
ncbi:MAG: MBL fold metallo-hydrolase [Gammaproteobacteria bacterium]